MVKREPFFETIALFDYVEFEWDSITAIVLERLRAVGPHDRLWTEIAVPRIGTGTMGSDLRDDRAEAA